jgi:hypothetical protein
MTINRYTGYTVATTDARGTKQPIGPSIPAGSTVSLVRVTSKICFLTTSYGPGVQMELGSWGQAIQVGFSGTVPPSWENSPNDESIVAYDSCDADATARIFWVPSTDTSNVQASLARTLEWRGQFHTTAPTQYYYVVADITNANLPFYANFGWQVWWVD